MRGRSGLCNVSPMPKNSQTDVTSDLSSPTRRNWVWFSIQVILRFFFVVWLRYRCRGHEKLSQVPGALMLLNHQSFLDPLLLGLPLQRPVSYVARESLFPIPIVGWILRSTYVMPLNRDRPGAEVIRESIRRIKHGFLVGIFPEATRTKDGTVGQFKPGFVTLLRRSGAPVYPVGIAGAFECFPRKTWFIRPVRVRVVVGEPFTPEQLEPLSRRGNEAQLLTIMRERVVQCQREAEAWRNIDATRETNTKSPPGDHSREETE